MYCSHSVQGNSAHLPPLRGVGAGGGLLSLGGGDQAVRGLGHSRGNSSDREWEAAEKPATTARRQQESVLTRVCSSRPLSHQSPDMMNLRDKMEPVATEKLEHQSWKVPRKSSVWSVQLGPQTQKEMTRPRS